MREGGRNGTSLQSHKNTPASESLLHPKGSESLIRGVAAKKGGRVAARMKSELEASKNAWGGQWSLFLGEGKRENRSSSYSGRPRDWRQKPGGSAQPKIIGKEILLYEGKRWDPFPHIWARKRTAKLTTILTFPSNFEKERKSLSLLKMTPAKEEERQTFYHFFQPTDRPW